MGVDNAALARRYLTELWGKGNLDLVDELVDPNIVLGDPMTPEPAKGIDTVKSRIKDMSKHFTESSITVEEVVVQGDTVIARARWTGKHTGDFFGIKPTNKTIKCDSAEVIKIKNGKVIENVSYFDVYTMFQQMGALPPPDQLKPKESQATSQTATA